MYPRITLRHFFSTCCVNNRIYVRVKYLDNDKYAWILPKHHAWPGNETINKIDAAGCLADDIKAHVFTDDKFDFDEVYGDYSNWEITKVAPSIYSNPTALDITIEPPQIPATDDTDAIIL